jgi:hypothetical protein
VSIINLMLVGVPKECHGHWQTGTALAALGARAMLGVVAGVAYFLFVVGGGLVLALLVGRLFKRGAFSGGDPRGTAIVWRLSLLMLGVGFGVLALLWALGYAPWRLISVPPPHP